MKRAYLTVACLTVVSLLTGCCCGGGYNSCRRTCAPGGPSYAYQPSFATPTAFAAPMGYPAMAGNCNECGIGGPGY